MEGPDEDADTAGSPDAAAPAARPRDPRSNSPVVTNERGEDVDVEQWDPMPEELRRLDGVDESDLSDPMDGPAPTG